jgi:hypothetical protein
MTESVRIKLGEAQVTASARRQAKFTLALTIPVIAAQHLAGFRLDPDKGKAVTPWIESPDSFSAPSLTMRMVGEGIRVFEGRPLPAMVFRPSTGSEARRFPRRSWFEAAALARERGQQCTSTS